MIKNKSILFSFLMVFVFLFANESKAQYSLSPSTILIKDQIINDLSYDSIHIANNSSDTLFLDWKLIQNDTQGGTYIDFCSSGNCWLGIPATGSFPPIKPGGFGWAGVHLWTGSIPATCTAKIYLHIKDSLTTGDTLTYILHAINENGIEKNDESLNSITVYPNPANDKLSIRFAFNKLEEINILLINLLGEVVYSKSSLSNFTEIPIDQLSKGLYFLKINSKNVKYVKKIVVSR